MRISLGLSILIILFLVGAANAEEPIAGPSGLQHNATERGATESAGREALAIYQKRIDVVEAQNGELRGFLGNMLTTVWSVIAIVAALFAFNFYWQSRLSDREISHIKELVLKPVQDITIAYARVLLLSLQAEGRWGGGNLPKDELRENILKSLRDFGLSNAEIANVVDAEYPYVCFDYYHYVIRPIHGELNSTHSNCWNVFNKEHRGIGGEPTPQRLKDFLQELGIDNYEVNERLNDYTYYFENRTHRRPKQWRERNKETPL